MTDICEKSCQFNEKIDTSLLPHYQKPTTSLFLDDAKLIQGGGLNPLESQGGGYLQS